MRNTRTMLTNEHEYNAETTEDHVSISIAAVIKELQIWEHYLMGLPGVVKELRERIEELQKQI